MSARLPLFWHFSTRKLYKPLQRGFDRLSTDLIPVAIELATLCDKRFILAPTQPYGTDRFIQRTTARPCNTADCDGESRAAFTLRTSHHGFDNRLADRPGLYEQCLGTPNCRVFWAFE